MIDHALCTCCLHRD